MDNNCLYCKKPVEDYDPTFCCGGHMCGCEGKPIDPPVHDICSILMTVDRLRKLDTKDIDLSCSFSISEIALYNGKRKISNKYITRTEAFYIIDLAGAVHCLISQIDQNIEKLKKKL